MSVEGRAAGAAPEDPPPVVLSLNVGSSSLKASVRDPGLRLHVSVSGLDGDTGELTADVPGAAAEHAAVPGGWASAMAAVADVVTGRGLRPRVVAHRIVHGSATLVGAQPASDRLVQQLEAEAHLDPLHLPRQLDVLRQASEVWPDAVAVLVPDDGFHRTLPDEAVALPLPADARAGGLRRWGFHGLAVQSVVDELPGMGAAVVVHLGSGCSVTAVQGGASRATTMSVSPAGGIPSVTRSGDLDPEVVLRLVAAAGGSVADVRELLNVRSGLAGLSEGRTDVRELLAAADPAADLALRVFVRQAAMAVAAAVTTLDGWDTLVFTGGIGVHSAEVRERVCARLLPLRPGAAELAGPPSERLVATGLRVCTMPVDEESVMDRLAREVSLRPATSHGGDPLAAPSAVPPEERIDRVPQVRVLVAAASRHGATAELAAAVADGVRRGLGAVGEVVVRRAVEVPDVSGYDAVVLGSAVYFGHWLEEARELLLRSAPALWDRPVWLFSSGPVGTPERPPDVLLDVDEELRLSRAREHRLFPGRLERSRLGHGERAVVSALRAPEGDFRDPAAAADWGASIGAALAGGGPSAVGDPSNRLPTPGREARPPLERGAPGP